VVAFGYSDPNVELPQLVPRRTHHAPLRHSHEELVSRRDVAPGAPSTGKPNGGGTHALPTTSVEPESLALLAAAPLALSGVLVPLNAQTAPGRRTGPAARTACRFRSAAADALRLTHGVVAAAHEDMRGPLRFSTISNP
jgi:hypothetical protein